VTSSWFFLSTPSLDVVVEGYICLTCITCIKLKQGKVAQAYGKPEWEKARKNGRKVKWNIIKELRQN